MVISRIIAVNGQAGLVKEQADTENSVGYLLSVLGKASTEQADTTVREVVGLLLGNLKAQLDELKKRLESEWQQESTRLQFGADRSRFTQQRLGEDKTRLSDRSPRLHDTVVGASNSVPWYYSLDLVSESPSRESLWKKSLRALGIAEAEGGASGLEVVRKIAEAKGVVGGLFREEPRRMLYPVVYGNDEETKVGFANIPIPGTVGALLHGSYDAQVVYVSAEKSRRLNITQADLQVSFPLTMLASFLSAQSPGAKS